MKRYIIRNGLSLAACAAAALIVAGCGHKKENGSDAEAATKRPPQSVAVITMAPSSIDNTLTLPGRVSAFKQSQVRPQVSGVITQRLFEEGANVEQGQQLYQIDDTRYKAALESAQADLKSAQSNLKALEAKAARYEELVKVEAVSQQDNDDVQAQLAQAKANVAVAAAAVDVAQVNLDYTKVYAPITGRISRSYVTEGALMTANQTQPMAVITQLDPIYVDMQQSADEIQEIRGQMNSEGEVPVTLLLGNDQSKTYATKGILKFSEVMIDETTGSVTLRAQVPNPAGILLPGLFVRAELNLGKKDALLIPQRAATRTPDGGLIAWVVDADNTAQSRPIRVGAAYQDSWIVTDGLSAGDRVIVEGYQKVHGGAPVEPAPWEKPSSDEKNGA